MKKLKIFSWILFFWLMKASADNETINDYEFGFSFQDEEEGSLSVENYIRSSQPSQFPPATEITLCSRVFLRSVRELGGTVFSYATETAKEIAIYFFFDTQTIEVICCDVNPELRFFVSFDLMTWVNFCLAFDTNRGLFRLTLNGQEQEIVRAIAHEISPGGTFLIGQDIDHMVDLGIDLEQIFIGKIVNFILMLKFSSSEWAINYTTCNDLEPIYPILIDFEDNSQSLEINGMIKNFTLEKGKSCTIYDHIYIWTDKMNYNESTIICSDFSSATLVEPQTLQQANALYDEYEKFSSVCVDFWGSVYWLGFIGNVTDSTWRSAINNKVLNISQEVFLIGWQIPKEEYTCLSAGGDAFPYLWYSADCSYVMCPLCNGTYWPTLTLRGLCEESEIDRKYVLNGYKNNRNAVNGVRGTYMFWENSTWRIVDKAKTTIQGQTVELFTTGIPIGIQKWRVTGDSCKEVERELLLTGCNIKEHITCRSNAFCIPRSLRCDGAYNCDDLSDEISCETVLPPNGYSPDLPPPKSNDGSTPLFISIIITSIREFNLVGFQIGVDAVISLKWRDKRLTFKNLKNDSKFNIVNNVQEIWLPKIYIEDGSKSPANVDYKLENVRVEKMNEALEDDLSIISEDLFFSGEENIIVLTQKLLLVFSCEFELQMYPFDFQVCSFITSLQDPTSQIEMIQEDGVKYEGQRILLEYELAEEIMSPTTFENFTSQKTILVFKNQYKYYVGNAILPSLLLIVICYLVFFYDINDFQNRVMVSLTSLLVLASLFSQTSKSIPKTAYMKFIDTWFIVLIVFDFCVIVVVVLVEYLRLRQSQDRPARTHSLKEKKSQRRKKWMTRATNINDVSKVLFPAIMVFFVGYYTYSAVDNLSHMGMVDGQEFQ